MHADRSLLRFCLVGVVNTVAGFGSIVLAKAVLGLSDVGANAMGHAVGLTVSFVLNRRFTFGATGAVLPAALRFLLAFVVAYALNLAMLLMLLRSTAIDGYLAQLAALVPYTLSFYVLSRSFVFAERQEGSAGPEERVHGIAQIALIAVHAAALALLVGAWFLVNGYSFGLDDHAIHLPFLLRTLDPGFLPDDPLLRTTATHPSLFWRMQAWGLALVDVHVLYLLLHVASVALVLAGTWALGRALFSGPRGAWAGALGCVAMLVSKDTCTWIMSLDDTVLNRTVSLGPLLLSLALVVRGRLGWAYALSGAAFNIHPTTAAHAGLLVFGCGAVLHGWRRALGWAPVFVLAALPLVVSILESGSHRGVPFPPPEDWTRLVRLQVWFHHFASTWSPNNWLHLVEPVVVLLAAQRMVPSRGAMALLGGVAFAFVAGVVAIEVVRWPTALHLHILEITRFLHYVAAVAGGAWVCRTLPSRPRPTLAMLTMVAFALDWQELALGLAALALVGERRPSAAEEEEVRPLPTLVLLLALAGVVALALATRGPRPFLPTLEPHVGHPAMQWSREHLPPNAVVATPPYMAHPVAAFRFVARRAIVGNFKDGAEGSFDVEYLREWVERMDALCECQAVSQSPARGSDDWFAVQQRLLEGYRRLDADGFRRLAARYGATHALVEKSPTREWQRPRDPPAPATLEVTQPRLPVLYEDEDYVIYAITTDARG